MAGSRGMCIWPWPVSTRPVYRAELRLTCELDLSLSSLQNCSKIALIAQGSMNISCSCLGNENGIGRSRPREEGRLHWGYAVLVRPVCCLGDDIGLVVARGRLVARARGTSATIRIRRALGPLRAHAVRTPAAARGGCVCSVPIAQAPHRSERGRR